MNPAAHRLPALIACVSLTLPVALHAQAAPAARPTPATSTASAQAPVQLSPFVVDDTQDVGYLANNTLAGSRLNTKLKDTPASISVLTSELLADLGAFQLGEALQYAVNVENEFDDARENINENATFQNYPTYRVRGLDASVSRNYFGWAGRAIPSESAFIDRIEDSRGPNSVLFGVGSPGGVINVNTKQALAGRAFRQLSGTVGSHDSWRGVLDVNQPLLDNKLATRLILVYNRDNEFRHYAHEEHQRALATAKYHFSERTRLRIDFERGQYRSNTPRAYNLDNSFLKWNAAGRPTYATIPATAVQSSAGLSRLSNSAAQPQVTYISNAEAAFSMRGTLVSNNDILPGMRGMVADGGVLTDPGITDYSINVGGPSQDRFTRYGIFTAIAEHQLGRETFLELGYNHVGMTLDSRDPRGGNSLKGDPNALLPTGAPNPYAGRLYLDTNWFRTVRDDTIDIGRLTFSTAADAGKWGHYRFALLGEYEESFIGSTTMREFWVDSATGVPAFNSAAPNNAANRVTRRTYPTEGDWGTYFIDGPLGSAGGLIEGVRDPVTGRTLSSAWYNQNYPAEFYYTNKTGMAVLQGRYFNGKLIAAGGVRRDDIEEHQLARRRNPATNHQEIARDPTTADRGQEEQVTRNLGTTTTLGLVYHVTPRISLYYNRADNLAIPAKGQLMLPASGEPGAPLPVPAPEGEGEDFGIGFDLMGGKLYAKAIYYTTAGRQQSTTSPAAMRRANTQIMDALLERGLISQTEWERRTDVGGHGLYDHESEGWEFQATANLQRNWRFQANYAITDAVEDNKFVEWQRWAALTTDYLRQFPGNIVTADGDTVADQIGNYQTELEAQVGPSGIGKLGSRRHKVSMVTRYLFDSGPLKGAYIGGAYRHQSKMFTGVDDNLRPIYGNSYWRADLMAGYSLPLPHERKLTLQLNVYNVFDERDPLVIRYDEFGAVYRHVVQPPITWRFTTTFEF